MVFSVLRDDVFNEVGWGFWREKSWYCGKREYFSKGIRGLGIDFKGVKDIRIGVLYR